MPIRVLSDQLASQIAAGEVVERPASVVKELMENAIDAGATTINVDIRGGGRQLIQVADDGAGIPEAEIELAFRRHATSKLQTAADLQAISTLGFRGEALASIAAVSQVTVVSRASDEAAGTRLVLEGGRQISRDTIGAPQGTVVAVANLFFNVPARLKFLKTVGTERRLIDEFVTRYALAYPSIRFRLIHDNRITFQSSGSGRLMDVLVALYGPEMAKQLLEIESDGEGAERAESGGGRMQEDQADRAAAVSPRQLISVSGYVGPPSLHRSNRQQITLFVNGRWIKDSQLTYAVIQAYHTLLPTGRFPLAVVFLGLPLETVDVNVHPAKTEVRLRDSNLVFGAIQRAVRRTLINASPIREGGHLASTTVMGWRGALDQSAFSRRGQESQDALGLRWPSPPDSGLESPSEDSRDHDLGGEGLPVMRLVGQVGASYIITEGPDGLFLIDQHAAHERILYEQFMAVWEEGNGGSLAAQGLVNGTTVHLSPTQASLLSEHLDVLSRMGFQIEPFGPNTFMIRAIPAILTRLEPARALMDVIDELERGDTPLKNAIESRLILRVCKSAAVKAGDNLSSREMEAMIRQLENCQNPHTCPHGRPTLIHLSAAQLAKEFDRT